MDITTPELTCTSCKSFKSTPTKLQYGIIRKEFADKFFTYSALCDFVESASALAPNVIIDVEGEVTDNLSKAVADLAPYTDVDMYKM